MKNIISLKKVLPLLAVVFVLVGIFNIGSYDSQIGLASLAPATALATFPVPPVLPPPVVRTCEVSANLEEVVSGSSVVISWRTTGFSSVKINNQSVSPTSAGSVTFNNVQQNTTYTLVATTEDGQSNCITSVTVLCVAPIPAPVCELTPTTATIMAGESVTLEWITENAKTVSLSSFGTVPANGSRNSGPLNQNQNYVLTVFGNNGETVTCRSAITVTPTPIPAPTCLMTPTSLLVNAGESVNLNWSTTNAASATLTSFGAVTVNGSRDTGPVTTSKNYSLVVLGQNGTTVTCHSVITVREIPPIPAPTCLMNPAAITINAGESVNLVWSTTNAASATLTSFGAVPVNGSRSTGAINSSTNYSLVVLGQNGTTVTCHSAITVRETPPPKPVPACNAFSANPATILKGSSSVLTWATSNASRVVINNGIGEVSASGTVMVTPLANTEYLLTVFGIDNQTATCKTNIVVNEVPVIPLPKCLVFTATPQSLPVGGGQITLNWSTSDATSVSISPSIGAVANNGTSTLSIATTTTFTLVVNGQNNKTASCVTTVIVEKKEPIPFTCQNNVTFSASPVKINKGSDATLTWVTTGVDSVRFDQGLTSTGLSGSVSVSPEVSTTYTLSATLGTTTIACPVSITVETSGGGGGGGGGSSSPRCELSISKNKISRGEEVTLRWDTTRAGEVELIDSRDKVLVTTKNLMGSEKSRLFDGSLKVSPTSDTTYTLTVKRGSRERVCKVTVDVSNPVVVTQSRDQQPLIAGISLSQVPYTGFEAGPILTLSFYLLLVAWALYVAYLLVIRRDILGGYKFAGSHIVAPKPTPEEIRPDVFVTSVKVPQVTAAVNVPDRLPVADAVIGYETLVAAALPSTTKAVEQQPLDEVVTKLENHAHAKKALLSSDAIRHFVGTTKGEEERINTLNDVITLAKEQYPSEDGWVVINEKRMRELCVTCRVAEVKSSSAPFVPTVIPEGSGSLAEAIVVGNIIAAYEMIGHRPMFALADAAADLDAVYRLRRGGKASVSAMLLTETTKLTDEQIMQMITALTGALDGVYTDEASAVKMAIMKAVKVVA